MSSKYRLGPSHEVPKDLPDGWEAKQLGQLVQVVQGGRLGLTKEKDYVSWGVPAFSAAGQDGFVEDAEFRNQAGVVLSAIGANCGRCFYAEGDWTTLANVQALLPNGELDARVLYYRTNVENYWERSGSAQPFIKPSSIKKAWIAYPSAPSQQRRIAEILSTVDEAIEQTEALIAKTQQIKAGLMHDLFTRGVTADGQLRPPREEAPQLYKESPLGWIPKDWTSSEFGSLLIGTPQNGLYKPMSEYGDTGVPIVRIDSFYDGVLRGLETLRRLRLGSAELTTYGLVTGDILVNRVNSIDYVGKSAVVPKLHEPVVFESNIMRCRVNRDLLLFEFAIRWLCGSEATAHFRSRAKSAVAQASINQQDVRCLPVPLPRMDEQQRICRRASAIEQTLDHEQANLDKLRRLKRGLMQDLLTGRIPVAGESSMESREVAANV